MGRWKGWKTNAAVCDQGFISEVVVNSFGKELVILDVQGPFSFLARQKQGKKMYEYEEEVIRRATTS